MKNYYIFGGIAIIAIVALIAFSGSLGGITGGATINYEEGAVKDGDTVRVDYWLTVDGNQIDSSEGRGPFEFTVGAGEVIPGFDKAVLGMTIGETKEVTVSGNDAYTGNHALAGKTLHFKITLLEIV